jgi:methyl-accepting chemotaxis protein
MNWYNNLKISSKLIIGFVLVAIIAGLIGIIGVRNISTVTEGSKILYENYTVPSTQMADVAALYQRTRVVLRDVILLPDIDKKKKEVENINGKDEEIKKILSEVRPKTKDNILISGLLDQLDKDLNTYIPLRNKVIDIALQNTQEEAVAKLNEKETDDASMVVQNTITKIQEEIKKNSNGKYSENKDIASQSTWIMIILVIAGIICSILIGYFLARKISKPIRMLANASERLASGDIEVELNYTSKDEIGQLKEAFRHMADGIKEQASLIEKIAEGDMTIEVKTRSEKDEMNKKLFELVETNNRVFGEISDAAEQVDSAARQVSASSQTMAQGATEQASTVEEINASIEEIASQAKENAKNSRRASDLASTAKQTAINGVDRMKAMMQSMNEINDASGNISKIIKVIDEIAFQTNILALNAAVEAARAGAHGKGFAVVAEEVRNLAGRSAQAAKETTELIEGSIKKTDNGTSIANETKLALDKIVEMVTEVADTIGTISDGSADQASAVSQISQAITQVAGTTQTNSSTAEESAAASEELSSQAALLRESVSRFKLKNSYGHNEVNVKKNKIGVKPVLNFDNSFGKY